MSVDPYDDRYRTGWDSYPGDYTNGALNDRGRAAHEYMDNRRGNNYSNYSSYSNSNPSDNGYTPYNGSVEGGSGRGWG